MKFAEFIDQLYEAKRMILSYNDTPIGVRVRPEIYNLIRAELNTVGILSKSSRQVNEIGGLHLSTFEGLHEGCCVLFEVYGSKYFVLGVED
jgi:hypothetical protein